VSRRETLIRRIDEIAANAWPAIIQQQLEGWRLRASNGVTRRANSVLALGAVPRYQRWLDEIEGFYNRACLPVRFQVSEAAPGGLDAMLAGMGYIEEAFTSVQTAATRIVLDRSMPHDAANVVGSNKLDDEWLDAFLEIEGVDVAKKETYRRMYGAIGPRTCYVKAHWQGEMAGVGLAVAERGWCGLFSIATASEHRGKGIGTQIVRSLAEWAQQNGAENLYLQVMQNNQPALSLYGKLGFRHLYEYHYRTQQL
jgi:ribosomal protein S18 acetylase RimI-like enzyme